jgi:hypothetical protein
MLCYFFSGGIPPLSHALKEECKMKRINSNPHIAHYILKRNKNFPNSKLPVLIYEAALMLPSSKTNRPWRFKKYGPQRVE